MSRYFSRIRTISQTGAASGYFHGCTAYSDNGRLLVVLRHRRGPQLRRPFPIVTLDPPTIEIDAPQNYEGFVALAEARVGLRETKENFYE
jgi:hypothetical protein